MLEELVQYLRDRGIVFKLRGDGAATFIYINDGHVAIEASTTIAALWIEFWNDADEECLEHAAKEQLFATATEAAEAIANWLNNDGA